MLGLVLTASSAAWAAAPEPAPGAAAPQSDENTLYELGVFLSSGLDGYTLSESEFAKVLAGMADGYHHRANVADAMAYDPQWQALHVARVKALIAHEKSVGQSYLDNAAKTAGAKTMPSGLVYIPLVEGNGANPTYLDQVRINFQGRLVDGTVFDSSQGRGEPSLLRVGTAMPCLSEGLRLMKVGGRSRVVCPSTLAYGDRGSQPTVRPGATLDYEIELLAIVAPAASKPRSDEAKAPSTAPNPVPSLERPRNN
jgi:FKBP-type peptidyl-prolyl cis-trans isomerase FkpA/FKBP-type peptidyl-prolyl cis-trans isomerase FklB